MNIVRSTLAARRFRVSVARTFALLLAFVGGFVAFYIYPSVVLGQSVPTATQAQVSYEPMPQPTDTSAAWTAAQTCARNAEGVDAKPFIRTELFFGSRQPDGTEVTQDQFNLFLDQKITPRFPDGLTLLTGYGQFRGSNGELIQETSNLLILLYPRGTARESSAKIEEIRELYETQFQQESVLRSDDPRPVCVSF